MPIRMFRRVVFLGALAALPLGAQQRAREGTITGVVRDSAARPIAGADVSVRPGEHRTTTDSAGRFTFSGLDPDNYSVRARRVGFAPETWDVKLTQSSRVEIAIVLDRQLPVLDTVKIRASRDCARPSIEAFVCRRGRPGGIFLDYNDIDDRDVIYAGEIFRGMPGLRVDFKIGPAGPAYFVNPAKLWGCANSLVNGSPIGTTNFIPQLAANLIAVEIYLHPDSVPPEFQRYTWPKGGLTKTGRCSVIVYWTYQPMMTPPRRLPMRATR